MFSKYAKSLPVITHHSICNFRDKLCISPNNFAEECKLLAENGWMGISLGQAEEFFLNGEPLPKRSLLMTFDDGYLDNYVNAWPILEKYGHKGVIFPVANLIENSTDAESKSLRPTLKDVWEGRVASESLNYLDDAIRIDSAGFKKRQHKFMNWDEARALDKSGIIEFGEHTLLHAGVFIDCSFEGFYAPADSLSPLNKEVEGMPYGMPLFKRGAESTCRAFIPSEKLIGGVRKIVPQDLQGAVEFFKNEKSVETLKRYVSSLATLGDMESDAEYQTRVRNMLEKNRAIHLNQFNKTPRSLCWPWGVQSSVAIDIAKELGFTVFFNVSPGINPPKKSVNINRINAKQNTKKTLSRIKIYSRPVWGSLYTRFRF